MEHKKSLSIFFRSNPGLKQNKFWERTYHCKTSLLYLYCRAISQGWDVCQERPSSLLSSISNSAANAIGSVLKTHVNSDHSHNLSNPITQIHITIITTIITHNWLLYSILSLLLSIHYLLACVILLNYK